LLPIVFYLGQSLNEAPSQHPPRLNLAGEPKKLMKPIWRAHRLRAPYRNTSRSIQKTFSCVIGSNYHQQLLHRVNRRVYISEQHTFDFDIDPFLTYFGVECLENVLIYALVAEYTVMYGIASSEKLPTLMNSAGTLLQSRKHDFG
jgi:hypothetical protein